MSNPPGDSSGSTPWGPGSEQPEGGHPGQGQYNQPGPNAYGPGQYGQQGHYGQQGQYGQSGQYGQPGPYGQGQYGQNQYGQNQYGQGQYGQQNWNQPRGGYPGGPRQPKKSNVPLIIGAVLLGLVVLGTAIFFLARPKDDGPAAAPIPTSGASATRQPSASSGYASPSSEANSSTGTLGQPVKFQGRTGSGTWTVKGYKWQTDGLMAPQNGAYLVLDIEIQCTEGTYNYGSLFFKGKADDGREYTIGFGDRGNTPKLGVGTLRAGEKTRGYLTLDAPQGQLKLVMTDLLNDLSSVMVPGN